MQIGISLALTNPLLKGVGVPFGLYFNGRPVAFNGFNIVKGS